MSWDSYIDNVIAHSKLDDGTAQIDKAAIIGQNGALWTSHNHAQSLKLSAAEALALGTAFQSADLSPLQGNGVMAEGLKYQFLRGDDELLCAKKVGEGALSCAASSTAVVIAHCIEGGQQGKVNTAACTVADYLKSLNM